MPDWITTQEAAELSGYHPEYVRRLAQQGKIGAARKGRDWWIDRDVLQSAVELEHLGGAMLPGRFGGNCWGEAELNKARRRLEQMGYSPEK